MIIEKTKIRFRKDEINGILYLPKGSSIVPLVIRLNGLPGHEPEKEKSRVVPYFLEKNIGYFAFDYVGVRKSSGVFEYYYSQENINTIITELSNHPRIDPARIGLFGESFGGAMAICHASRDSRVKCLAVRSLVYDTEEIPTLPIFDAMIQYWKKDRMMRFPEVDLKEGFVFQTNHYNPKKQIEFLDIPIRVITGTKDELFSYKKIEEFFNQIPPRIDKKLKIVEGANHNFSDTIHMQELQEFITGFFGEYL